MSKFLISLKRLEDWFHHRKRVLPWRDQPSVYRVWISEIMLQQTQVITVIPYFEKFVKKFPSVEDLAAASEEDVLLHWAGLGYYSRARNLHRGAKKIVERQRFPSTREEWLEIPGVGNYTAGAVLSIATDLPEAILDGNVERVLSRVRCVSRQLGDGFYKTRLWNLSRIFVETAHRNSIPPSILNQALMELGATVCTPKKPLCGICPLADICRAQHRQQVDLYPPKKKPKQWIQIQEEVHCVIQGEKILVRKRMKGEWRAGLWDMVEKKPEDLSLTSLGEIETKHIVTRHRIQRTTQIWKVKKPPAFKAAESQGEEIRWISIKNPEVPLGSAFKKTLSQILERLS